MKQFIPLLDLPLPVNLFHFCGFRGTKSSMLNISWQSSLFHCQTFLWNPDIQDHICVHGSWTHENENGASSFVSKNYLLIPTGARIVAPLPDQLSWISGQVWCVEMNAWLLFLFNSCWGALFCSLREDLQLFLSSVCQLICKHTASLKGTQSPGRCTVKQVVWSRNWLDSNLLLCLVFTPLSVSIQVFTCPFNVTHSLAISCVLYNGVAQYNAKIGWPAWLYFRSTVRTRSAAFWWKLIKTLSGA